MDTSRGKLLVLRIGLIAAVIALFVGGIWKYRLRSSAGDDLSPSQVTGLYVNPERLNFGEVWQDDRFAWVLPIENHSPSDVTIERFYNSCVCTEINPSSLVIPAGQSRDIRLTIDLLTEKAYDRPPEAVRDFAVAVQAVVKGADGKKTDQGWEVRGRVKTAIQFEQPVVDFGTHSELAQPLPPRRIAVRCFTRLDSLAVSGSLHNFPVRVTRRSEGPLEFDLEIVPKAGLPVEEYKFDLSVVPILPGKKRLAAKKLHVVAWVVPDLQASPPEVALGAVPVGESAEATITLSSLTGCVFTVEGWHCTSDQVTVERKVADTGDPAFQVKWARVSAPGQQRAEIVFRATVGGKDGNPVKVPVTCLGIAGENVGGP